MGTGAGTGGLNGRRKVIERGADCLQTVNTNAQINCGKIYYESKRTQTFQKGWIEKFRRDMQEKNVDIGVLVTQAMPKDTERLTQIDGVWVCSFDEFKSMCVLLREEIVKLDRLKKSQTNRGTKADLMYDYLTSNEFKMQIEGIISGFTDMRNDLAKEKMSMERIWKKREKQLDMVLTNTSFMYGSVQGIAGPEVKDIELLELGGSDED